MLKNLDIIGIPSKEIIKERIDGHLKFKLYNQKWLGLFLNNNENNFDIKNFPYLPDEKSSATLDQFIYSNELNNKPLVEVNSKNPKYLVLIPAKSSFKHEKVLNILNILKNESYGTSEEKSKCWVKANLAVVIALNRPKSLDSEVNQDFFDQISCKRKVEDIAYHVFGFFWYFKWKYQDPKPLKTLVEKTMDPDAVAKYFQIFKSFLYPVEKSYLLLKSLNPQAAKEVRESLEDNDDKLSEELRKIIDMRKIRERLLTQSFAQEFLDHFSKSSPESPKYLCSADADVISLHCKEDGKGLFEHYDNLITEHFERLKTLPNFLTTGYRASDDANPFLKLTIDIDMEVRKALTSYFPAYFPEPNFVFLVANGVKVSDFSFIRGKKSLKLESLRLMQDAFDKKLAISTNIIFGKCGQIATDTKRMETKKNENKKVVVLNKKEDFQSLRSNRAQSHAFPKTWAEQIYNFLNFKVKGSKTNITTQLMMIYNVFHPISLIENYSNHFHCKCNKSFKSVMNFYNDYLNLMVNVYMNITKKKEEIQVFCDKYENGSASEKQTLEIFLNHNIDNMFAAKATLQHFIEKSSNPDLNILINVVNAAIASANAIAALLKNYI